MHNPLTHADHGNLEGTFLQSLGKPLVELWTQLKDKMIQHAAQTNERKAAQEKAEQEAANRQAGHRGGHRPWPIRWLIALLIVAEAVMAHIAVEALVSSASLAAALAILVALMSAGLAFAVAHRRLDGLPVPKSARAIEAAFVLIMFLLRYVSLRLQGGDMLAAVGGSALAALITAAALYLTEEIIVATETVGIFVAKVRASRCRARAHRAEHQHHHLREQVERGRSRLEHRIVRFLVEQGVAVPEAETRAAALTRALDSRPLPIEQEAH
jgi:hypothetical protein